jgi:hypothetical protein
MENKTRFRNMRTPFWNFISGLIMFIQGLVIIISLGFLQPDWYSTFLAWKLLKMFDVVK